MADADVGPLEGLQFGVELATLAGLGYWGYANPVAGLPPLATALGIAVVVSGLWWLFAAPRSRFRLEPSVRLAFQAGVFGAGVLAVASVGRPLLAAVLAILAAIALVGTGRSK